MSPTFADYALATFQLAAQRVPAYRELLEEANIRPEGIRTPADFVRLPILSKHNTFSRFPIEQLCVDGELGPLESVLTSSGHSGIFAFGLNASGSQAEAVEWTDQLLDLIFSVRSRKTLLINCLPMGVKVLTHACTLAETSVRPDMVIGLLKAFHRHFEQVIIIGDPGFTKLLLEMGQTAGVDWRSLLVQVILGEETLPENARIYFERILGIDPDRPDTGMIVSSMGIGEVGLNLFFEMPAAAPLVRMRRLLHENRELREAAIGSNGSVPTFFSYDPRRIFVEFDDAEHLILTTLDPRLRLPLVRYLPGDVGGHLRLSPDLKPTFEAAGIPWSSIEATPIVLIKGRGHHLAVEGGKVYPEDVKEGIYRESELARQITANFRLVSLGTKVRVRIQLSPGIEPSADLEARFASAIAHYAPACFDVVCERYETFGSGMALDYERKFDYLGSA